MSKLLRMAFLSGALAGALAAGCQTKVSPPPAKMETELAIPPGGLLVPSAPPPYPYEIMPHAPGLGMVWLPGAYDWDEKWKWDPGRWERPPHPGAIWAPHHCELRNGKFIFFRGGWR